MEAEAEDPLLSVSQVARMWGAGLDIVVELVASLTLPSLDRGDLISQEQFEVPLIRRSWRNFTASTATPRLASSSRRKASGFIPPSPWLSPPVFDLRDVRYEALDCVG